MGAGDFGNQSPHERRSSLVLRCLSTRTLRMCPVSVNRVHCQTHRFTAIVFVGIPGMLPPKHSRLRSKIAPLERVFRRSVCPTQSYRTLSLLFSSRSDVFLQSLHIHEGRVIGQPRPAENGGAPRGTISLVTRVSRLGERIERTFRESHDQRSVVTIGPQLGVSEDACPRRPVEEALVFRRDRSEKGTSPGTPVHGQTAPAVAAAASAAQTSLERGLPFAKSRPPSKPDELSHRQLQCLTERVLTTLDHRIVAMRERLGRT